MYAHHYAREIQWTAMLAYETATVTNQLGLV